MTNEMFIKFVMYEWAGAHNVPCFFVGVSLGDAEHSLAGPFRTKAAACDWIEMANDYRPGGGDPVATP